MIAVERRVQRVETQSPEISELPLSSTFPINPEISFRRTNSERSWDDPDLMTEAQLDYYQTENLICFLCEFAGKVPYKKIPGVLTDKGELRICNLDVVRLAENSVRAASPEWVTRFRSEEIGWKKALNAIELGANQVHIVSPPAIADYMLTCSLHIDNHDESLDGRPVQQIISRFDETMDSLSVSRRVFDTLANEAQDPTRGGQFEVAEDFLEHPICSQSTSAESLTRTLQTLGITDHDIAYSDSFEREIRQTLKPMIDSYLFLMKAASKWDPHGSQEERSQFEQAHTMLDHELQTIFSFAKKIAKEVKAKLAGARMSEISIRDILGLHGHDQEQYYQYVDWIMYHEPPVITGGTQCPSANSSSSYTSIMYDPFSTMSSTSPGQFFHSLFTSSDSFWKGLKAKEKYKFDREGTCQGCRKTHNEVGLLGPCYVCRGCQRDFDSGKRK